MLPIQYVRLNGSAQMWQPTDFPDSRTTSTTDKEVTGIHFCEPLVELAKTINGGIGINGVF